MKGAMDGTSSVPELESCLDSARTGTRREHSEAQKSLIPIPGDDRLNRKVGAQMGSPGGLKSEEPSKTASGDMTPLREPSTAKLAPSAYLPAGTKLVQPAVVS